MQMLGVFKILVGVNAVIAHYPLRLLNIFVAALKALEYEYEVQTARYKLHAVFVAYIEY